MKQFSSYPQCPATSAGAAVHTHEGCCCNHHHHEQNAVVAHLRAWMLPLLSAVLLLAGAIVEHFLHSAWADVLYIAAYLPVGLPVMREAYEEMREGSYINEFTLMIIATLGACALGDYAEAVAVMLLYSIGEQLQDMAVGKAKRDIKALVEMKLERVTVERPGTADEEVAPEAVVPGNVIRIPAGGRVPLDGELLDTAADFDTATLTGESLPRIVEQGGEVLAGSISVNQSVRLRVTRPYEQSALARIMHIVQDAASRKAPAEQFIRRFARIYTPVVVAMAVLIAIIPSAIGGFSDLQTWTYRALVFLVVSCPCALVISVPLSYFSGIGRASARGILFKGSNYLDAAAGITHVVFDKTGTLTEGRFECKMHAVQSERPLPLDALCAAASAEQFSTHPMARAIVTLAHKEGIALLQPEHVEEIAGKGLRATIGGHEVLVGNSKLIPAAAANAEGSVHCLIDGTYAAAFSFADTVRPQSASAVTDLRKLGVGHIEILSGDNKATVAALAGTLGVEHFGADLLPEGKVARMQELIDRGGKVAFVGDGINDAPVMALSHVAFAMGGAGSDVAVETADVVIQSDNPAKVAEAVSMGRATRRLVRQNIAFALGVKIGVLALGAFGMVDMWTAVFSDTGVTLLCVANVMLRK